MTQSLPSPQEVLDKFIQRDEEAVEEVRRFGSPPHLESRLNFTSARAHDTASMVVYILRYLAEQEIKNGIR
jgi:hypothetical protein